jgi:hypothetical protein
LSLKAKNSTSTITSLSAISPAFNSSGNCHEMAP